MEAQHCNHHAAHTRKYGILRPKAYSGYLMPNLMNYLNGNIQQLCLITKKGIQNCSMSVYLNNLPLLACRFRHNLLYLKRIIFVRED